VEFPDIRTVARVFASAISQHYFDLTGRIGRREFSSFIAGTVAVFILVAIVDWAAQTPLPGIVVQLLLLPPIAGMGARRLQDSGRAGALVFLLVVPIATMCAFSLLFWVVPFNPVSLFWYGTGLRRFTELAAFVALVALIYLWLQPGTEGDNLFGPSPAASTG
jgi:uncharacterized membrane protein YhaH (DUF805 family)